MKVCTKCGIEKPLDDYYRDRNSKDGRMNFCISCDIERRKKYYQDHREDEIARSLAYAKKTGYAATKRWRILHRKEYNKWMREYNANKDK